MSEYRKNKKSYREKKPLSHGWIVVPSKTYPDRIYYYNTVTKCSTWNNPCETLGEKSSDDSSSDTSITKKSQHESLINSSKKRQKSGRKHPTLKVQENNEIEDYDEDQDLYFANMSANFNRYNFSPPSNQESEKTFIPPNTNFSLSVVKLSNERINKKELQVCFASVPENLTGEKSPALCSANTPSTSCNTSIIENPCEREKKSRESRSLSISVNSNKETASIERESKGKRKRKRKRAQSESKAQEKINNNIIKNVTFKKRDKTPAQTRLLKLRQENAEYLKKMAENNPNFPAPKTPSPSLTKIPSNVTQPPETTCNSSFSAVNFEEEMDWEPSNEEMDVQNINEFRQTKEKVSNKSSYILFGFSSDTSISLPSKSNSWVLVLDTNIFVSCLSFIKELRDTNIPGLGYPLIYIPWRVLQELDHLKDSKCDHNLRINVRRAISYLNESFKTKHPRCFGQSYEDFVKMVVGDLNPADDEILQICMKLQLLHPEKKVTLLTNDKNLENKAIVSNVEAFSKERFQKKYLSSGRKESKKDIDLLDIDVRQIDNIVCAVKNLLKKIFPTLVETEMKEAFHNDWKKVAYKKPPWTLQDSMDCFTKHYRSVFFVLFPKSILQDVEKLYGKLFIKEPGSSKDVKEILLIFQRLLDSIKMCKEKERPYLELIDSMQPKVSRLLEELTSKKVVEADEAAGVSNESNQASPVTQEPVIPQSLIQRMTEEIRNKVDIELVHNLFKEIWDSLRDFCCRVSDLVNCHANNVSVPELRLNISRIIFEIGEFINLSEKLLQVPPNDITIDNPLIAQFSNILDQIQPQMAVELKNRLPNSLTAFFTDMQGRTLLSGSLSDFKEFLEELMKSNENLKRIHPNY